VTWYVLPAPTAGLYKRPQGHPSRARSGTLGRENKAGNSGHPFMRLCTGCQRRKRIDQFAFKHRETGRRQARCRACMCVSSKAWYAKNQKRQLRNLRSWKLRRREVLRADVLAFKKRPCADCRRKYPPYVMHCDHVRGQKRFNISDKTSSTANLVSVAALHEELAKCDVVCSNCHAERTHRRKG